MRKQCAQPVVFHRHFEHPRLLNVDGGGVGAAIGLMEGIVVFPQTRFAGGAADALWARDPRATAAAFAAAPPITLAVGGCTVVLLVAAADADNTAAAAAALATLRSAAL